MKKCTTYTFHILPPPADLAEGLQMSSLTTTRHRGPVRSYYIANSTLASSTSTPHGDTGLQKTSLFVMARRLPRCQGASEVTRELDDAFYPMTPNSLPD